MSSPRNVVGLMAYWQPWNAPVGSCHIQQFNADTPELQGSVSLDRLAHSNANSDGITNTPELHRGALRFQLSSHKIEKPHKKIIHLSCSAMSNEPRPSLKAQ